MIREELTALVLWLLEGEGKKTLLYPFCLPRLAFFQRFQQLEQKIDDWLPGRRSHPERRAIKHLAGLRNRLERDKRFITAQTCLDKGWQAFCELREVLQLSNAELPNGDGHDHPIEVPALEASRQEKIAQASETYQEELRQRLENSTQHNTTDIFHPEGVILKYFDNYGKHLFGHPTQRDTQGNITAVVERTNNVPEHFFGAEKRKLRRRVGRAHLGRDLEDQPAQAALTANLMRPDYVRVVCGSLENLDAAFAALSEEELEQASVLSRENRDSKCSTESGSWLKNNWIPALPTSKKLVQGGGSNRCLTR